MKRNNFSPLGLVTMQPATIDMHKSSVCLYKQETAHTLCHNQKSFSTKTNDVRKGGKWTKCEIMTEISHEYWIKTNTWQKKTCWKLHSNWNINFSSFKYSCQSICMQIYRLVFFTMCVQLKGEHDTYKKNGWIGALIIIHKIKKCEWKKVPLHIHT